MQLQNIHPTQQYLVKDLIMNNIDFGDSNCSIEESVKSFWPDIDTVQSKVSP